MNLKNKKILITGINGFIGSNLKNKLKKRNIVVGLGNKKNSSKNNKNNKISIINLKKLNFKPDIIFNCVGSGTVMQAEKNKKESNKNDYLSTKIILDYANSLKNKVILVFFSSAAVYGNSIRLLNPISIYGKNKLKSEIFLKKSKKKNIRLIILRYFSVYGNGLRKQLIWDTCNKIKKKKLYFFGQGNETRSWLHINDAIDVVLLAIRKSEKKDLILDCHSSDVYKNSEIINKIIKIYGSNKVAIFNKIKDKFSPINQISRSHKLKKWKWKAKIKIDDGLKKYVKWFKSQI